MADRLMYATWMLKRKPLSTEDIEDFGDWKLDLKKAWAMMYLSGEKHWATLNHFIATRLDKDVHATVVNLFPEDEEGFAALDPEILLQQIEERLVTMDQTEQKRLRFELAKQVLEEDLWKYKN